MLGNEWGEVVVGREAWFWWRGEGWWWRRLAGRGSGSGFLRNGFGEDACRVNGIEGRILRGVDLGDYGGRGAVRRLPWGLTGTRGGGCGRGIRQRRDGVERWGVLIIATIGGVEVWR